MACARNGRLNKSNFEWVAIKCVWALINAVQNFKRFLPSLSSLKCHGNLRHLKKDAEFFEIKIVFLKKSSYFS